jgi:hypothetical protein
MRLASLPSRIAEQRSWAFENPKAGRFTKDFFAIGSADGARLKYLY